MTRERNSEQGTIMLVAMLAMVALISLGGLTTLAVRGGLNSGGQDRFKSMALFAAESGAHVAIDFLRSRVHATDGWAAYVHPKNDDPLEPGVDGYGFYTDEIQGNRKQPGELGNLFSPESKLWYEVRILNNLDEPGAGFDTGADTDKRVIVRSTGYGPRGTVAQVEVEIRPHGAIGGLVPGDPYAQKNMGAANQGVDYLTDDAASATDTGTQNLN